MAYRIALASDHAGFELKQKLAEFLRAEGHAVIDFGTNSQESVDYPDYAFKAGEAVKEGKADVACLICHSGIGMCMAANKISGIRAALCWSEEVARLARRHNDANVICIGSGFTTFETAARILRAWLETSFEGGRHERRINKIKESENS